MKAFERWQVVIGCLQTALILLTFIGALCIGLKQNEINQNLLDLNFSPSLEIAYSGNQFQIYNRGRENIWLYGTRVDNDSADIQPKGRLIPPGGFYYIPGAAFERRVLASTGNDGKIRIPMEFYIEAGNGTRYTVRNEVLCETKASAVTIHNQTIGLSRGDWAKNNPTAR